jgi:hypothetical protein
VDIIDEPEYNPDQNQTNQPTKPQIEKNKSYNRIGLIALLSLCGLFAGVLIWKKANKPQNDGSFAFNFTKPESFVDDNAKRIGEIAEGDSNLVKPIFCNELLQLSDKSYQNEEWEAAVEPLLMMAIDTTGMCVSDAYFYLGVLQLEMKDPMLAIQCFTKIEDFTKYSEDIQWYQALAVLQMAEKDNHYKERAQAAMNNILKSAQVEDRKERAKAILEKLSN